MKIPINFSIALLFLFVVGCSGTSTTTKETESVQTKIVDVPVTPVQSDQTINYDTSTTTWHEITTTPQGDTVNTTVTEVVNIKKPKSKPSLHIVQTVTIPPVKFADTTSINKTKTTEIVKTPNPIMTMIAGVLKFIIYFIWWILFAVGVVILVIYLIRKKIITFIK